MAESVALITGALTGIGRATAVLLAHQGAHVVVSGRRDKEGQDLAAELQALGAKAEFIRADVRSEADVRHLVDQTVKQFGRLDIAVNNAGTEGLGGLVTEQTAESYAATFAASQERHESALRRVFLDVGTHATMTIPDLAAAGPLTHADRCC
jgi:NAD(P)-dependent dehydrogenase (short-subunit alcohol dehydrogenase family)